MPIDPNIILGVKPPQFQQTDPLESYGKSLALKGLIGQQELQGLQTQQARQGIDDENAVRSAYQQSGGDPATLRALLMKSGQHKAIDAFDKRQLDTDKAKTDIAKNKMELAVKATAQHRDALANVNDPQAAAAWVQAGYQDPALREIFSKAGPVEAALQGIPQDPEGFQKWKQQNALGATKFIELNKPSIHDAGGSLVSTPGLGGIPAALMAKTQTPDSVASQQTAKATLAETRRHHGVTESYMATPDMSDPDINKQIDYWANVVKNGGSLPPGLARSGSGFVKEVTKRAAMGEVSPKEMMSNQAQFGGEKAGQHTLGNRTANIEMAVTEAQNVIPIALAASEKVDRTKYPNLNSVLLAVEKGTGDENVVKFAAATNALINIYSRAIAPSGVPTVSDKDHAREIISAAYSKGQFKAVTDLMTQEMGAARQSPGQVKNSMRDQFTGKPEAPKAPGIDPSKLSDAELKRELGIR